jgi:UDP-glucose 4-epimerase
MHVECRKEGEAMRVLVTGGAGFIGSHLVDRLVDDRHDVAVVDDFSVGRREHLASALDAGLDPQNVIAASIVEERAASAVGAFRPDLIMLLAAQSRVNVSMRDPRLDLETNIVGLANMLEAARRAGVRRVVFAASGGTIYGSRAADRGAAQEDAAKHPASFYGLSKYFGGEFLRLYHEHFGIECVALALGNVYGPRQDPGGEAGVVAAFADRLSRDEPCTINGDGRATRDYVYVSDAVEAFVRSMTRGCGLINIGPGVETSVHEV